MVTEEIKSEAGVTVHDDVDPEASPAAHDLLDPYHPAMLLAQHTAALSEHARQVQSNLSHSRHLSAVGLLPSACCIVALARSACGQAYDAMSLVSWLSVFDLEAFDLEASNSCVCSTYSH